MLTTAAICIQTNKMHEILVIRLYFLLDALHVSDYISPSSGATLQAVHRIWYMPVSNVWLLCDYSHTTARRMVPAYTGIYHMRCTACKVAPDDGLI